MTYTYDPTKIKERGKDQMRFEVGDTLVDGNADTCALSDEEYESILADLKPGKRAWVCAKLAAVEAILFKLSYQPDTKIDVLEYKFSDRVKAWERLRDDLKKEAAAYSSVPVMDGEIMKKPPYFYTGMEENPAARQDNAPCFPFRNMTD